MNTAVIVTKTEPEVKLKAQRLAAQMGFTLSALINGYLRQLTRTETVHFTMRSEELSDYLKAALRESELERKTGKTSPTFDQAGDALEWLNDPARKYES